MRFETIAEPYWDDRDVYIIGGGTSLKGFDFSRLSDKFTLGVNKSAFDANTKALFSLDRNFIHGAFKQYHDWEGEKYLAVSPNFVLRKYVDPNATYVMRSRGEGLSLRPAQIFGGNSGLGALNLAYHKRAKRVFLLGFDFHRGEGKGNHWHKGYNWGARASDQQYLAWAKDFLKASQQCKASGIIVVNVGMTSKLEGFEKIELDGIS